jgi:hypothetical protein
LYRFSEGWGRYRRLTSEVGADEAGVDTDMDGILRGSLMGPQGEQRQQLRHLVSAHGAGSFGSEDRRVEDPSPAAGISTYRPPAVSSRSPGTQNRR